MVLDLFSLHNYSSKIWEEVRITPAIQSSDEVRDIYANETITVNRTLASAIKDTISKFEVEHGSKVTIESGSFDILIVD